MMASSYDMRGSRSSPGRGRWLRVSGSGRALGYALLAAALLAVPVPAFAQAPDPAKVAAAQTLFEQAQSDMEKKDFSAARKKLEEVVRVLPDALGARITLAECYEGLGKLASAWSTYTVVEALAQKANQKERAEKAAARVAALRPKLATLTVEIAGEEPGLVVTRDEEPVGSAQWGTAIPIDVGEHWIKANAPGGRAFSKRVVVAADGSEARVRVELSASSGGANPRPWHLPLGVTTLALGGVGLALGGVMGGLAMQTFNDSNDPTKGGCNTVDNTCTSQSGPGLRKDAGVFADVSTAAFIAGGVLAGAGLVLTLTAPKAGAEEKKAARVGVGAGSVWVTGTF